MIYMFLHTIIARFVTLFIFWIPEVVLRKKFELKNKTDLGSRSFKEEGLVADLCFEFSSEGEFAQVSSLIEDALERGRKIELVMFSPSVEKQVLNFYEKYPTQIRYLRYPILTYQFWSYSQCFWRWTSADNLYLVRYDFFPEFLYWARSGRRTLKMLWLSFKKDRLKNKRLSTLKKRFLKLSSQNVFATQEDLDYVRDLGIQGIVYDFRMEQIYRRKLKKEEKFSSVFQNHSLLMEFLNSYSQKLIFGNAWESDLHLLENLPATTSILIVPHLLDEANMTKFELALDKLGLDYQTIDEGSTKFHSQVLILNKKGVLCELYSDFSHAYVGGGFGVSVHSVLEPLVNGVGSISCGPINHRSTEVDVAKSFNVLSEVQNAMDFSKWLESEHKEGMRFDPSEYQLYRKEVIGC